MNSFILASFVLLGTLNMVVPYSFDMQSSSFRDNRATHVTFWKNPDGTCFRRVVTYDNGRKRVDDQRVDCKEAEKQMKAEHERVKAEQAKTQLKISQQFQKVNEDIKNTQQKIQDQLKSMNSFHSFRWY